MTDSEYFLESYDVSTYIITNTIFQEKHQKTNSDKGRHHRFYIHHVRTINNIKENRCQ